MRPTYPSLVFASCLFVSPLLPGCGGELPLDPEGAVTEEASSSVEQAATAARLPTCKDNGTGWAWPWEWVKWTKCTKALVVQPLAGGRSLSVRMTLSQKAVPDILQGKNGIGWAQKDESYHFELVSANGELRALGAERAARYYGAVARSTANDAAIVVADLGQVRVDAFRENGEEVSLLRGAADARVFALVSPDGTQALAASGRVDGARVELTYRYADGASLASLGDTYAATLSSPSGRTVGAYEYDVRWPSACAPTTSLYAPPPDGTTCDPATTCWKREDARILAPRGAVTAQDDAACLRDTPEFP